MLFRLIIIFASLFPILSMASEPCALLLDRFGRTIFDPVVLERSSLEEFSSGYRAVMRTGKVNRPAGWYERYRLDLINSDSPEHEGLVEVIRRPLIPKYRDSDIVDSINNFPEFYVNPNPSGYGNYLESLGEGLVEPYPVHYTWRDYGNEREVSTETEGYLTTMRFLKHFGLVSFVGKDKVDGEKEIISIRYSDEESLVRELANRHLPPNLENDPLIPKGFSFFERRALQVLNLKIISKDQRIALYITWEKQITSPTNKSDLQSLSDRIENLINLSRRMSGRPPKNLLAENFTPQQIQLLIKAGLARN